MAAPHSPAEIQWTTRKLLAWMGEAFTKKDLDSPRLLAELLMAHVVGCDRLKLYMDQDRPATPLERESLRDLVARALKHEPVQYLVGEAWFFGLPFKVDRRVLIPRPCTETMVEYVLQHHRATHGPSEGESRNRGDGVLFADVCAGSGAIAVALLKNLPGARGVATDISNEAINVTRENAARHGVTDRLDVLQGDLLKPLRDFAPTADGSLDYLVSNPPYIPDDEWPGQVDRNVLDHEPHVALRGGVDGMSFARPILRDGAVLLKAGGMILVEVAASRAGQALEVARSNAMLKDARVLKDHEGLDRVVLATRV